MKVFFSLLASLAVLTTAQAQFRVDATPAGDGGGTRSGSGTFLLTLVGTTMTINGTFSGLSGNSTAAHIHGPSGPFPASASVIYDFTPGGLNLATLGSTSGGINGSFELVPKANGAYTVAQQMADLNAGQWYVNVHSTTFGGGEIRGQILAVPEPSTWLLAGLGVASLLVLRRRQNAQV
ncbi:MAG TPA: CHRD domain-containing protein [Verrucomicrobiae bacterium]|jgi:hypothetical protein|nr:CHRD domain-containing protein [Verrucomicrobiae bacterium]